MHRTYLFAPGSNPRIVRKAFEAGADAVILDLEDAVPQQDKASARTFVAQLLEQHRAWVRVNEVGTDACRADLDAVAENAHGIRIPKVESAEDVEWVASRCPGLPIICAIETARGILAAPEIADASACTYLALGGLDLRRDLSVGVGTTPLLHARSRLVLAARAAGIAPPIDSVYGQLDDDAGLQDEAEHARSVGFFGKSAIHPRQLPIITRAFTPTATEICWANDVLDAFARAGQGATTLPGGEFVDAPVAARAQQILERASN
ncbi:CoA ester lyase [Rhodococcus erythropolis]|uniref:HpcH/HpaI aldolase/citrate lyase family protein n=1 Tax=Rhodococcus erythropolis TaxID=1833 RepID=UPI0030140B46